VGPIGLTAGEIAAATGGRLVHGDAHASIDGVSIDSRTAAPGDLFVAIRGDRFDGHQFAADALDRGAAGAVVEPGSFDRLPAGSLEPDPGTTDRAAAIVIEVEDTTRALQDMAREVRRRSGTHVVAITGSAGKTTTKEVAAEFLSARYRVFRNKGNLNNHIGLPLSLLELGSRPEVAVVELGMNRAGEIRTLVGIAEPEVRVWTNVGDAHLGFFDSAEAIADAKGEILEGARESDVLVANAGDLRIMQRAERFAGRVVTFGVDAPADVEARAVRLRGLQGTAADVRTPAGSVQIETPLLGLGNLANVMAAIGVALEFDIPLGDIATRAAKLAPAHHRGELLRLPGGVTIVDDSYNSSPAALKRTLETIGSATGSARKIAVLGEMLELGPYAEALHEACGSAAAAAGLDLLIAVGGPPARALADAAIRGGMPAAAIEHVGTKEEAAAVALRRVRPGDLVLVKGSRGIGTDLVVERLKAEFA
jgi:UDP-N-acetylmuramoyl-tripeptide--D-alanyl-D-alanine ligase